MSIILKYFADLSDRQIDQFDSMYTLYTDWNSKINVISRKDMDYFFERHVLHSLAISKIISFVDGTQVLDVGTGGGFPGIPLSILFPNTHFCLVDSIGKKIKVVNDVSNKLQLNNVTAIHERVENIDQHFEFVVSRAVTNMPQFFSLVSHRFLTKQRNKLANGILYLKGGDLSNEMALISRPYQFFDLHEHFQEEFFKTKRVVYIPMV